LTTDWNIYRTRFLVKARQLTTPYSFTDALGHEHFGDVGDYLVESSAGTRHIARREVFEDIYVAMGLAGELPPLTLPCRPPMSERDRRPLRRATA